MRATDVIKTIRMSEKALQLRDLYGAKRTKGMRDGSYTRKAKPLDVSLGKAEAVGDEIKETKIKPPPQYTFEVDRRANKHHIRQAIRVLYPKVTVTSVNTMNVHGKPKRQNTRLPGYSQNWKKAIVTLKDGDSIDEMI